MADNDNNRNDQYDDGDETYDGQETYGGETYGDDDGQETYDGGDDGEETYYTQDQDNANDPYAPRDADEYTYNEDPDRPESFASRYSDNPDQPESYASRYSDNLDDDESRPLGQDDEYSQQQGSVDPPADMPSDYYADEYVEKQEYYEEDDAERARRARRRRAWCCCLCLLCCLLLLIIFLIILLWLREDVIESKPTPAPTNPPFVDETDDDYYYEDDIIIAPGVVTTEMADYDFNCDFADQEGFAHVFDQCDCDGQINIVPQDVENMRNLLVERMVPVVYDFNYTDPIDTCDPLNMALIWLASGDQRDSGEIRQRFVLALSFFALNGTIWDYNDEWLGDLNECLWLGVQCNNRDVVNSIALDTNNIFGLVSWIGRGKPSITV